MKSHLDTSSLQLLPDTPGVYLFYGPLNELLYVGKSKSIRTRIRSHIATRNEARLMRRVRRVEVRETAGELGALLLESQLIKELRPMFNVASRQRRRLIIARRVDNKEGYASIVLEAVDRIELDDASSLMAMFKHRTQATEYLTSIARAHRLCPKLLRIDRSPKHCFWYHLGWCGGACSGEEDPARYNARVEEAFAARRLNAWPYVGGVVFEERSEDGRRSELFYVDNWCLLASQQVIEGNRRRHLRGSHRFDYDSYKILYGFLTAAEHQGAVTVVERSAFESLWKQTEALPLV